jgi:hypothetical protein
MIISFVACNEQKKSPGPIIENAESSIDNSNSEKKSRLITFSKSNLKTDRYDSRIFLDELEKFYPDKYDCSTPDNSIITGDINQDGNNDVLFRYSVDDLENRTWVACGWFIAFSNNKNEFENYIFYDWVSGSGGAPTQFDFGFPNAINEGIIYSEIDDFKEGDESCCPSIKRKMTFSFDKELGLMSLINRQ